jgi:hypothetical protein
VHPVHLNVISEDEEDEEKTEDEESVGEREGPEDE